MATTSRRRKTAPALAPNPTTAAAENATPELAARPEPVPPAQPDTAADPAPKRHSRASAAARPRTAAAPDSSVAATVTAQADADAKEPLLPAAPEASEPAPARRRRAKPAAEGSVQPSDAKPKQPPAAATAAGRPATPPRRRKQPPAAPALAAAAEAAAAVVAEDQARQDLPPAAPPPEAATPTEAAPGAAPVEPPFRPEVTDATDPAPETATDLTPVTGASAPEPHSAQTPGIDGEVAPTADEPAAADNDNDNDDDAQEPGAAARRKRRRRGRNKADVAASGDDPPAPSPDAGTLPAAETATQAPGGPDLAPPSPVEPDPADPMAEATRAVAPPAPPAPLPPTSRLSLNDDGLQCRLRWQAGSRCPDTLMQAVHRWADPDEPALLQLTGMDDLAELQAVAARLGHRLDVDDAVWTHLARLGDLQGRISHLEAQHPQGLDPAAQADGHWLSGWRACQLEAAFFAAAVGRCVLADDAALQPEAELLLAARLVMTHFGTPAPVLVAPAEQHAPWQAAWHALWSRPGPTRDAATVPDTDAPVTAVPTLTLLTPEAPLPEGTEVLLMDQRLGLDPAAAALGAAQACTWLWVLASTDLLDTPQALPLLRAVDTLRQGALAQWQGTGDATALAPLLLARRFADVAEQWPAWAARVQPTPALTDDAAARTTLQQRLARWQRSGYLADSDQLALRRALQALWAQARAANIAALPGLLRQALEGGARRIVVFSEDASGLDALAESLQADGLPAQALPGAEAPRRAEQVLRTYREAPDARILLVADGAEGAEPRIGVQLAAPLLMHLDTPWHRSTLARRMQRVRPARHQREVPVWQLLPGGSTMTRRALAQAAAPAAAEPVALAPAPSVLEGALLRGPALAAWLEELRALWPAGAQDADTAAHPAPAAG